jgi:uncharacterized protein YjeT (DUF2065 family)
MSDFFWEIALGVSLFMFGLDVYMAPKWYDVLSETYMDFSGHHHFWGIVWMSVGIIFVWVAIRQRIKNKGKEETKGEDQGE